MDLSNGDSQLNNLYFKERNFRADLLSRVIFLTFRVDLFRELATGGFLVRIYFSES